jgi:hypothetical protein
MLLEVENAMALSNEESCRIVAKFPAHEPGMIVRRLVEYRRGLPEERKWDVPAIDIFTTDGHVYAGWAIDFHEREEALLLHSSDNMRGVSESVLYLHVGRISAVQVHEVHRVAPLLSWGAVPRAAGEKAPTRLELQRSLRELREKLKTDAGVPLEVDWEGVGEEEEVPGGPPGMARGHPRPAGGGGAGGLDLGGRDHRPRRWARCQP